MSAEMVMEKSTTPTALGTTTSATAHPKRDNLRLNLTVPSLFRCPISMDVMKSPVSLCTGVTYDRASIQTWISQGHNTCPATMQVLPSTDFTPNLTLRRLIRLYHHHLPPSPEGLSPASSPSSRLVSRQEAVRMVKSLASGEDSPAAAAARIADFVRSSEENRRFIAGASGSVSSLVEVLRKSEEIEVCGRVMVILELISPENGVKESMNKTILKSDFDYLSKFVWIFRKGGLDSRIASAKVLESIALDDGDSKTKIAEHQGLLAEIHRLGDEVTAAASGAAVEASLSALISVSSSRAAKKELVRLGIVRTAARVLSGPEPGRAATEKAMEALMSIARCAEGRGSIGVDPECVAAVVRRLMKCSGAATEHGVMVLWSLCCLGGRDAAARDAVAEVNGTLTKVLLVMQSDCSAGVREMCGELVKVLRTRAKDSKSCLASYDSRTTHIMPY